MSNFKGIVRCKTQADYDNLAKDDDKIYIIDEDSVSNGVSGVKGSAESSFRHGNVELTKANIGLSNVDNTSDLNKPVSTATQTAINAKLSATDLVGGNGVSISGSTFTAKLDSGTMDFSSGNIRAKAVKCGTSGTVAFWKGTQAEYDALGTYDSNTFYIIVVG